MKKIFTLTVLALFMSLSAMADWSLGNLAYNIQEGATVRMSKVMKSGIKVTFPEVTDNKQLDVTLNAVLTPETGDAIQLEGPGNHGQKYHADNYQGNCHHPDLIPNGKF